MLAGPEQLRELLVSAKWGRAFPPDTNPPFALAPGEKVTMPIEDPEDYPALKTRIEKWRPISDVTAMDGGIMTVFFEDGTRWVSLNHSYSRPAEQAGEWTKPSFEEWAGGTTWSRALLECGDCAGSWMLAGKIPTSRKCGET